MDYQFSNLLGAPYRGGSLLLDGDCLICPAGNRVREVRRRRRCRRPPAAPAFLCGQTELPASVAP